MTDMGDYRASMSNDPSSRLSLVIAEGLKVIEEIRQPEDRMVVFAINHAEDDGTIVINGYEQDGDPREVIVDVMLALKVMVEMLGSKIEIHQVPPQAPFGENQYN